VQQAAEFPPRFGLTLTISVNSSRLAALLDKLVAVDLDLAPIFRGSDEGPLIVAADAIADACDILRSAIADLRKIIHS
jgi:hypothetical protein